jgi:spore germination protein KA
MIRTLFRKKPLKKRQHIPNQEDCALSEQMDANQALLEKTFAKCTDVVFRQVNLFGERKALLVYIDGMIDRQLLDQGILHAVLRSDSSNEDPSVNMIEQLEQALTIGRIKIVSTLNVWRSYRTVRSPF